MLFDIGISPMTSLMIAILAFAILSDFLLELFSVRMSLSTGRIQSWLFDHIGQNLFTDFLIAIVFQFFSFRKKAFFMQFSSLANVGSFNRKQTFLLVAGSLVGVGLSVIMLVGGHLLGGVLLCCISFLLSFLSRDQIKDVGVAFLGLGLFWLALFYFDQFIMTSGVSLQRFEVHQYSFLILVVLSTLLFRTPVAFLLTMAMFHFFIGLNLYWLPAIFFVHSIVGSARFYWFAIRGFKRLHFSAGNLLSLQLCQLGVSYLLIFFWGSRWEGLWNYDSFLASYRAIVFDYFLYLSVTLVLILPVMFVLSYMPFFKKEDQKKGSQKIFIDSQRGSCFSIHLSLFLLRQEFKKFTTTVHTLFKMSRETDHDQDELNQKFVRYQGVLTRVGDELKDLCFSIGKQRSYRWQIKEIMSYYRYINQLELLVEDLAAVNSLLRKDSQREDWEKDCRYWLGLQLKIFESFLNDTLGVGEEDSDKVKDQVERSFEFLDRFFGECTAEEKRSSKIFYRITESNESLAL